MATLSPNQQGTTYRSALGMLGRNPDWSHVQLAIWLRESYQDNPSYEGISYSSYAAVARRAAAAHFAGEAMENDPGFRIPAGQLEQIPGSQYADERYLYRLAVTWTDRDGNTVSTIVEYESATVVSRNDIVNDLAGRSYETSGQGTVDFAGLSIPGGAQGFEVTVLAAGKRAA